MIYMKQTNILDLFRFKSFRGFAIHVGKMRLIFTVFYLVINPQIIQEWYISIHNHSESGLSLLNISQKQANANSGMHNDCKNLFNKFQDQYKGRVVPVNKMVDSNYRTNVKSQTANCSYS